MIDLYNKGTSRQPRSSAIGDDVMRNVNVPCLLAAIVFFGVGNYAIAETVTGPHTVWKVGDTWKIQTYRDYLHVGGVQDGQTERGAGEVLKFTVVGICSVADLNPPYGTPKARTAAVIINGKLVAVPQTETGYDPDVFRHIQCFEIRVDWAQESDRKHLKSFCYFRADLGNLIRVDEGSGTEEHFYMDYPVDPNGPVLPSLISPVQNNYLLDLFPCPYFDFPDFSQISDFSKTLSWNKETKRMRILRQVRALKSRKDEYGVEYEEQELAISEVSFVEGQETEAIELRKIFQIWRKGDPWWRKLSGRPKHGKNSTLITKAELVVD